MAKIDYISHFAESRIQSVKEHNENVAKIASKFTSIINFQKTGEIIGYLHDVGKYNDNFQEYIKNSKLHTELGDFEEWIKKQKTIDHGKYGGMLLYFNYHDVKDYEQKMYVEILSLIITYHHGGLNNFIMPNSESDIPFFRRLYSITNDIEKEYNLFDNTEYNATIKNFEKENKINIDALFKSGLEEFKNFLKKYVKIEDKKEYIYFLILFLYSCLVDADRIDTQCFIDDIEYKTITKEIDIENFKLKLTKYHSDMLLHSKKTQINELRTNIYDQCEKKGLNKNGIFTLTVPTGGGKTISSLAYAINNALTNNLNRIIYCMPFTTIIEQNAEVYRTILGKENVFEHHSNVIKAEENKEQYDLLSHNWDYPFIISTFVQFFNSAFSTGTQNIRKLHNLAKSVIIFDEIQSVPVNCIGIFNIFCNFLKDVCNSTIILCSATQPAFESIPFSSKYKRYKLIIDGEIIDDPEYFYDKFRRNKVINKLNDTNYNDDDIIQLIDEVMMSKNNLLFVVNTKTISSKIYNISKEKYKTYLLNTNFCPAHRKEIITQIKKDLINREKFVCVSTQLIEAGVDISFEHVVRDLASASSIAQSAGRNNRNGEFKNAETWVVNLEENLGSLKDIKTGKEIVELMYKKDEKLDILNLKSINEYYTSLYSRKQSLNEKEFLYSIKNELSTEKDTICEQISMDLKMINKKKKILNKIDINILPFPIKLINENFDFINQNTYSVIVPYKKGKDIITNLLSSKKITEKVKILEEAQQYSINIYSNEFEKMISEKSIVETDIKGIFILSDSYYDEQLGYSKTPILKTIII